MQRDHTDAGNRARTSRAVPLPTALEARFQRVYEENYHLISGYVFSRVGNREDAEDLTASIFLKAATSIDYGRAASIIHQWLFKITQNTLIDHWRARKRVIVYSLEELLRSSECEAAEDEPGFRPTTRHDDLQRLLYARLTVDPRWEGSLDENDESREQAAKGPPAEASESVAERIRHLLGRLPAHYRDVLSCRFLRGLTIRDTALHLGLSEANVKVTQLRALKRAAELAPMVKGG